MILPPPDNADNRIQVRLDNNISIPEGYGQISIIDVYVIDGDTVHGQTENGERIKVRMTGIDAPESSQTLGAESTKNLKICIDYSPYTTLIYNNSNKTDKYGRYLAKVVSGKIDCNLRQVEMGMAFFYDKYADELPAVESIKFKNAQQYAQINNSGVWITDMQKPWDYRQQKKGNK